MVFNLTRIKYEVKREMLIQNSNFKIQKFNSKVKTFGFLLVFLTFTFLLFTSPVLAIVDPLASPNNRFGIHIITSTPEESSPAAQLVNSSGGDWGYITVLIESNNRDHEKWQKFFNDLRERHLIPLVRLATQPEGSNWKLPYEGEEVAWADFLDNLIWPTKNRYIIVYNEPNQSQEWAGQVNPVSYAKVLDKTITALKNKNPDFFVLNAGFDASAPFKPPLYFDEVSFLKQMEAEIPGILNRLDGWVSHSYPNPGFRGTPDDYGKGTVWTWEWEQELLESLGVKKKLPIFITETGWKHAEGINYDKSLPTAKKVAEYFLKAFRECWNNPNIVAITPFLLNYQEAPFDHFSFKKPTGESQKIKLLSSDVLGVSYPEYYPAYQALMEIPKLSGRPVQENKAELKKGEIYASLVAGETYTIPFTFKNTGQSVWNESEPVELRAVLDSSELGIEAVKEASGKKVEPGKEGTFYLKVKAPGAGNFTISIQLFSGNKAFDTPPLEFDTQIKNPVILSVTSSLLWKKDYSGDYILSVISDVLNTNTKLVLDKEGRSQPVEARYLLPEYSFKFTLYKPFYKPKTIEAKVKSGTNLLDFGMLTPDILSALLKPEELLKLLPF